MLKIAIITTVVGGTIVAGHWYISAEAAPQERADRDTTSALTEINSFDDCVAAGYPIMESLPEQCATNDGRTFTNTHATLPVENDTASDAPTSERAPETDDATAAIEAARAHAAKELAVEAASIDLATITREDWPDSCLGLPEEDEVCAMMMVAGYEITFTANEKTVTYRTDQDGDMVKQARE